MDQELTLQVVCGAGAPARGEDRAARRSMRALRGCGPGIMHNPASCH